MRGVSADEDGEQEVEQTVCSRYDKDGIEEISLPRLGEQAKEEKSQ